MASPGKLPDFHHPDSENDNSTSSSPLDSLSSAINTDTNSRRQHLNVGRLSNAMQPVDASLIPRPYLVEPEQDFDNGDFSSSHYNKIAADPRTYRRSISNPSAQKDKTNDDGTTTGSGNGSGSYSDNGDDSDDYSTIKDRFSAIPRAIPANGATQHRESFLSMSLKKSNSKLGLESPQKKKDGNDAQGGDKGKQKILPHTKSDKENDKDGDKNTQLNENNDNNYADKIANSNDILNVSTNTTHTNNKRHESSTVTPVPPRPSISVDAEHPDPATIDIVSRHLVNDDSEAASSHHDFSYASSANHNNINNINNISSANITNHSNIPNTNHSNSMVNHENESVLSGGDEFDSLQLQGGDIHREIYNWKRDHTARQPRRAKSFTTISRTASVSSFGNFNNNFNSNPNNLMINGYANGSGSGSDIHNYQSIAEPDLNVSEILLPGGFRRSFIAQKHAKLGKRNSNQKPAFFTRNFIEFLTLYGHFAGEEFSDEEDDDDEEVPYPEEGIETDVEEAIETEHDRLLPHKPKQHHHHPEAKSLTFRSVLLLLKAFIGTGILFLPKGFYNGGLLFCIVTLVFFSALSYWCFLLLIDTRTKAKVNSFGDIGDKYFGPTMRKAILTSIVLSQIGFASAYIVFVAQNLQSVLIAFARRGSDNGDEGAGSYSIPVLIFIQLLIFIPLSLTRKIAKLSGTALVADFFILLGIVYIYYTSSFQILAHGIQQVQWFNPNEWTTFIGTAVFTYEGIGLLIPIQESMKHPQKFTACLGGVMVSITLVFVSIGAVCYLAYGAKVQTVILNNFPQDSATVNIVQLLYALAILLSTPLQLFPAIRILEAGIFGTHKSGKFNNAIKWNKNMFRVALVVGTSLVAWVGNSDLDKFVAMVGSFACVPLIYIYPPLLHIKSYAEEVSTGNSNANNGNKWLNNHTACYFNVVVLLFGCFMMLYTSLNTIQSWIY